MPSNFKNPRGEACLCILDDLLNDVYSIRQVCDLFTKGSHHCNISVILITHNIFHQDRHCRDISLNAKYQIFLKNVRDRSQFSRVAQQVYPQNIEALYASYLQATARPHGYIVLDLMQGINDLLRLRTAIFRTRVPPP